MTFTKLLTILYAIPDNKFKIGSCTFKKKSILSPVELVRPTLWLISMRNCNATWRLKMFFRALDRDSLLCLYHWLQEKISAGPIYI